MPTPKAAVSAAMAPCFRSLAPFILASASPRRREMLATIGLKFEVDAAETDEQVLTGELPEAFVLRVAKDKALLVADRHPGTWVLAADTAVVLDGKILGKPADAEDAVSMLQRLAGRDHEVWTGFYLYQAGSKHHICRAVKTDVQFADLSEQLIKAYVQSGDPLDKAGSYGIQSLGGFMVRAIHGSYSNVVGLPLAEVIAEMTGLGLIQAAAE